MPLCKIAELTDRPLDWAVQEAELRSLRPSEVSALMFRTAYGAYPLNYSTDQACGGPVIVRADIQVARARSLGVKTAEEFCAYLDDGRDTSCSLQVGSTRLQAGMRCYAVSRLGEYVEVPERILNPAPASGAHKASVAGPACAAAA